MQSLHEFCMEEEELPRPSMMWHGLCFLVDAAIILLLSCLGMAAVIVIGVMPVPRY
jgi:hypothetical protein